LNPQADLDLSNNCLVELPLSMGLLSCKVWNHVSSLPSLRRLIMARLSLSLSVQHFGCDGNPLRDLELIKKLDMGVDHTFLYLEKRMEACIPFYDREEYLNSLGEKRPPLSPICTSPLPSMPFRFTASGNIRLAAPRSIPTNSSSNLLSAFDMSQDDKTSMQKQKLLSKSKEKKRRTKPAQDPKGSDSDSLSSSSSSPGLERDDPVAEQPAAPLDETKGTTEESEKIIHGKLTELKALSENLIDVILEIGTN
jgi:hypothetical protein